MEKVLYFFVKGAGSSRATDSCSGNAANAGSDASVLGETEAGVVSQPVVEKSVYPFKVQGSE